VTVVAAGLFLFTGIDERSSYTDLLPGLLIGGLGGALTIPLNAVALGAVPVEKSGVASGIFNTAREAGGSLGIAIIGAVLAISQRAGWFVASAVTATPRYSRMSHRSAADEGVMTRSIVEPVA
jgi:hypothetical protein